MKPAPPDRFPTPARAGALEVRLLGLTDFTSLAQLQEKYVYELGDRSDGRGALLLTEHPPLITIGREGSQKLIRATDAELQSCGIERQWVARGGSTVIHAPGQLAISVLLPLEVLSLGLTAYRQQLEAALLGVCHELRVPAKRDPHGRGLWSRGGQVAHLGGAVHSGVTVFGAWLNVAPDPAFLELICAPAPRAAGVHSFTADLSADPAGTGRERADAGTIDRRVTSLQAQLLRRIPLASAREAVIRHVAGAFGYHNLQTFTGHSLLQRTRRTICVARSRTAADH